MPTKRKKTIVVPIISARRGSSLKNKNIWRTESGDTLLALAIKKCLALSGERSTTVDVRTPRVVTDSPSYGELARKAGAKVLLCPAIGATQDVSENLRFVASRENDKDFVVMLVQCTSPLLSHGTLLRALDSARYIDCRHKKTVAVSCVREQKKWTGLFFVDPDTHGRFRLEPLADKSRLVAPSVPRQKIAPAARFTGAVSVIHAQALLSVDGSFFDAATKLIPIWHESVAEAVDIDTREDALAAGITPC